MRIKTIENATSPSNKIIRVMPNTPALVSQAMCVICPNTNCTNEDIKLAEDILGAIGKTLILDEKYIDAVTGMSGCGPAYAFTFIQAMADAGVKLGLTRANSVLLACQTLKGSAEMVMQMQAEPFALRNMVTSPGGSTIAGVHVLEKCGFSGIIMDAVEEAAIVSGKLGEKK